MCFALDHFSWFWWSRSTLFWLDLFVCFLFRAFVSFGFASRLNLNVFSDFVKMVIKSLCFIELLFQGKIWENCFFFVVSIWMAKLVSLRKVFALIRRKEFDEILREATFICLRSVSPLGKGVGERFNFDRRTLLGKWFPFD